MKRNHILGIILLVVVLLIFVDPVYAGPGGAIAKGLFKTWWGKLLMIVLGIILLPLILYIRFREYLSVRKNKKELLRLSTVNKDFRWSNLQKIVKNAFERVYIAWDKENMEEVSSYVSSWYWQNQQLVHLDEWKRNNQKNVCKLHLMGTIKPLHLEITDEDNLEGSRIAFIISADIEDYLIDRDTKKVVYGKKGYQNEEHIWIMEYTEGKWLLDEIRDGSLSLAFAKMGNIIPEVLPRATAANSTITE
jgi:hypothetical protein